MTNFLEKNEGVVMDLERISQEAQLVSGRLAGMTTAFKFAGLIEELETLLTPGVMAPIMKLQGTKLGFLTDKDDQKGYPLEVVRKLFIEATLLGINTVNNEWNIIASNLYITKNGMKTLLQKIKGLEYSITPGIPLNKNGGAVVEVLIEWTYKGKTTQKNVSFAIRVNNRMGADAIIGKTKRKARAYLYENITGMGISDGEIEDIKEEKNVTPLKENPILKQTNKIPTMVDIIKSTPASVEDVVKVLVNEGLVHSDDNSETSDLVLDNFQEGVIYEDLRNSFYNKDTKFVSIINKAVKLTEEKKV